MLGVRILARIFDASFSSQDIELNPKPTQMSILRGTKKLLLAAGLAGCGAAAAVIFTGLHKDTESFKAHASTLSIPFQDFKFSNFYNSQHSPKWDYNWDKREPGSLIPPLKGDFGDLPESDQNAYKDRLQKAKASATRHIILIRHGQYKMDGLTDELRQLTVLGRDQANRVGERLRELDLPYTRIIKSTMTRATETADIIHKHLPDIPMSSCDFIREGSPIVPEPPVSHWKPEPKVRTTSRVLTLISQTVCDRPRLCTLWLSASRTGFS